MTTIDATTQRYLELVSGCTGEDAVRQWIRYTGYVGDAEVAPRFVYRAPELERLRRARAAAHRWWDEYGRFLPRFRGVA